MSTVQSFSGRKLLERIPCRPAFDGSGVGVAVQTCDPRSAHKVLEPEKMSIKPTRSFSAPQINAAHDLFLEAIFPKTDSVPHAELVHKLLERTPAEGSPKKYTERPDIAFMPSKISFDGTHLPVEGKIRVDSGEYTGKCFSHSLSPRHWLLVLGRVPKKKRLQQSRVLDTEADNFVKSFPAVSDGQLLRCVACGERDIDADGFLLCFYCNTHGTENYLGSKQHLDFGMETLRASLRKDSGFQDDEQATAVFHYPLLDTPLREEQITESREKARKIAWKKNFNRTEEEQLAKAMIEVAARPLDETELAWILSVKCEGWTIRNSQRAWKKAQRVAAQLVGHYIFGKSFGEVAKIVGKEEEAVRKVCVRHRREYFNKLVRQPMPEEARTALASGMLRELYPPAVTTGQQGWGEFDAEMSRTFPEPEKIVFPSAL